MRHAMNMASRTSRVTGSNLLKGNAMKTISAALLAFMMLAVAGCNTVEGAGKDVKASGQAIEKAADKAKPN